MIPSSPCGTALRLLLLLLALSPAIPAQTITTVAGNGTQGFSGDGGPATAAALASPQSVALDAAGNVFIASNNRIRRISASTGIISTVAGNGTSGLSGDGGPATAAALSTPTGLAVDSAGNLFLVSSSNIRRVSASTGIITTVAGNGTLGYSGDGGPATAASLWASGVAVDSTGNLFIADFFNNRIRRVSASTGIITTVAGNGTYGYSGDGGPATAASLRYPYAVAVDSAGNLLIADQFNERIRRVSASTGIITTVAGNGTEGFSGDGGPATSAALTLPPAVAVDGAGNVFIVDQFNNRVRRVSASTGIITTVAGNGPTSFSGDYGPGTAASLAGPRGVAVDGAGNLFIADSSNHRVRRVALAPATSGVVQVTPAGLSFESIYVGATGVGQHAGFTNGTAAPVTISSIAISPDFVLQTQPTNPCANGLAVAAGATCYLLIAFAPAGDGVRAGTVTVNHSGAGSPRTVTLTGTGLVVPASRCAPGSGCAANQVITTIAGTGTSGFSGDGGPATSATLSAPTGVAVDSAGNLFIVDMSDNRIRRVSASTGIITTVAGNGAYSFSGDGGPATSASLSQPYGVAVDSAGNVFIADAANNRIRRVSASTGIITTVAGSGPVGFTNGGYGGDGGPATAARLNFPKAVAVDRADNLLIADSSNSRIRRVSASTGLITTVAGGGSGGDGGPATSASLAYPYGVAVDSADNILIADTLNQRIRRVSATTGIITTVAGSGTLGYSGDGGLATSASLRMPSGVAVDSAGGLLIADTDNSRVRRVDASTSIITTVAGNGTAGFNGNGGLAVDASLNSPAGVAMDGAGNILVADTSNHRVRAIGTARRMINTGQQRGIDSSGAAAAGIRPTCGSQSVAHGVWVKYTAPVTGTVTIDLAGSNYQTLLTLFTPVAGTLQLVDCTESQLRVSRSGQRTILQPKSSYTVGAGQDVWVLITATIGDGGLAVVTPGFLANSPVPQATFSTMMPHVVTGGGYVTKLTIVNMAADENNVAVNFVDDQGTVLSSATRVLQPAETMRVATDEALRNGPIATQWASISAQGRVAANLFYEISDQSPQNNIINTVGFNDDAGAQSFTIPVEFEPAPPGANIGRTVGLALSNPNNVSVQVALTLRDTSGANRGTSSVTLPPYGHTQRALNADFQSVLPAGNFVGTVTGTAPQAVNVVALGDDFGPFFATPPMTGGTRLVVPHIVTGNSGGAGYVTKLLLVNQAQAANSVTIAYFNQSGVQVNPFNLPTSLIIPANGAVRIATPEAQRFSNTVFVEWALITASSPLGANLFFEIEDQSTAVINTIGFNNAPELTDFTLPVELEPPTPATPVGRTVGLTIANANGVPTDLQLTLLNQDGSTSATTTLSLGAMSQTVVSLQNLFPSLPSGNFLGALVVHSSVPVAAIALEDDYGPFSAVPVVSGRP